MNKTNADLEELATESSHEQLPMSDSPSLFEVVTNAQEFSFADSDIRSSATMEGSEEGVVPETVVCPDDPQVDAVMAPGGSGPRGNTRSRGPSRKRSNAAKKWVFTWNNYPESGPDALKAKFGSDGSKIWAFAHEVGESGTPHLQGFVIFSKKRRPIEWVGIKEIHWEKMKGSLQDNVNYVSKEDGQKWLGRGVRLPRKLNILKTEDLYPWQKAVWDLVQTAPHDRKIYWFWERTGNVGKSALVRKIAYELGACLCSGKAADMKYQIAMECENKGAAPDILVFDIPRQAVGYVSYTGMEEMKNGAFFSSKYEGKTLVIPSPHVVCFANSEPAYDLMSQDRWEVFEILGGVLHQNGNRVSSLLE